MYIKIVLVLFAFCSYQVFGQCRQISIDETDPLLPKVTITNEFIQDGDAYALNIYRLRQGVQSEIAVSCSQKINDGRLEIKPLVSLGEQLEFMIVFSNHSGEICKRTYKTPLLNPIIDEIDHVQIKTYPKSNIIPKNILCFHLEFNKPMIGKGNAFEFVEIVNEKGHVLPNIWRHKTYWLKGNTIMVLMIHPGRVKRGIDMPIPFEIGETYKMRLKEGLKTINGTILKDAALKTFKIIEPDYVSPIVRSKTKTNVPKVHSHDTISILFNEGMDYASIQDGFSVRKNNTVIKGKIIQGKTDKQYTFIPKQRWEPGVYQFVFKSVVSDFCGNGLKHLFESKLDAKIDRSPYIVEIKVK
ncbi:MAG: Ig-like domain-containing protein [Flavobacteriales bacterium]